MPRKSRSSPSLPGEIIYCWRCGKGGGGHVADFYTCVLALEYGC